MLLGEIDSTYLKYHKVLLKRHPPTKYDNSVYIEHTNYDGAGFLVKKAREENPYVNPKMAAIDYRFWSVFHFKFYETVLNTKMKLIKMKWIDFTHLEAVEEPVKEDVLELVDKYKMRDIMSFKYDWNIEVLAQFHATFFHEDSKETIHWMTEGVHYKIDFITFARLFGFSKEDREADIIHFEAHMNHSKIVAAYEYDELADGSTTALRSVYYVLNNMFRETIYPKGGSDSTILRRFAPNLIARLLPGARPFSVSRFIWYNLVEVTESGKCNLPYAPYIIYMIEMVSGVSFKKDVEHASYQVKQWQHQKRQQVVEELILKKASSKQHKTDPEGPSKAPMPTGLHKLRGMVRDTWRFCNWIATQMFELREVMNRLLKHQGLSFNAMLHPPPIFPDFLEYTTSEDEGEKDPVSPMVEDVPADSEEDEEDAEPLRAKMAKLRKEVAGKKAMGSSSGARVRRKATAERPVRRPIDLSSGSGSDFDSDSTVPEAEEDASDSSDEE
jgi:hypothetical protein